MIAPYPQKRSRRPYVRRHSAQRWKALQWLKDHDEDINATLLKKAPTKRMIDFMLAEGQVERVPLSGTRFRIVLTDKGRDALATKRKHINGHISPVTGLLVPPARYKGSRRHHRRYPEPQDALDQAAEAPAK